MFLLRITYQGSQKKKKTFTLEKNYVKKIKSFHIKIRNIYIYSEDIEAEKQMHISSTIGIFPDFPKIGINYITKVLYKKPCKDRTTHLRSALNIVS